MKISLIVNTHNKCISLILLLISILRQTLKDIEVIIINDSNKFNKLLTFFINKAKFQVIVINDSLPISNLKNKALNIASGEYIMFLNANDYLKSNALELMYNSSNNEDVIVTHGYKKFLCFRLKENFYVTKSDNTLYHNIYANNKLIRRSVLLENPFMNNVDDYNLSNIPIILSNYKIKVISNRLITSKINKSLFNRRDNILDVLKILDYIKPKIPLRDYKNIAILEILYRLENYFYSKNENESIQSRLKDELYKIDNYWFDYEIIKIMMDRDLLFKYFINHANL